MEQLERFIEMGRKNGLSGGTGGGFKRTVEFIREASADKNYLTRFEFSQKGDTIARFYWEDNMENPEYGGCISVAKEELSLRQLTHITEKCYPGMGCIEKVLECSCGDQYKIGSWNRTDGNGEFYVVGSPKGRDSFFKEHEFCDDEEDDEEDEYYWEKMALVEAILSKIPKGQDITSHSGADYVYLSSAQDREGATSYALPEKELINYLYKDSGCWHLNGLPEYSIDLEKIRRRVRDALNKTDDAEKLLHIAGVLSVKIY